MKKKISLVLQRLYNDFERYWSTGVLASIVNITAPKKKISVKNIFNKFLEFRSFSRIFSHTLEKSLRENFIF